MRLPVNALPASGIRSRWRIALLPLSLLAASLAFGDASAQGPGGLGSPAGANAIQPSPAAVDRAVPLPAAGVTGRQAGGTALAAAGVPGRRADPPPAVPASPAEAPEWFWRDAEIAQAFECPIGPIAKMLAAAQGKSEFSPALELEREVLVLCRDRWAVLKALMDAELSLAAVLRKDSAARERMAIALEEQRQLARARVEGARQGAVEAAREAEARKLAEAAPKPAAADPEAEKPPAPAVVVVQEPAPAPEERYGWFAMSGSGTDLRAGVTDGEGRWWVRAGDTLPGDVRIEAIRARPPGVIVEGGAAAGLPYRRWGR